jgi:ATP-dependent DNA helicase RecQ
MTFPNLYTKRIFDLILKVSNQKGNQIFVILGQTTLVDVPNFEEYLVDIDTFKSEKNEVVFNKQWFTRTFTVLSTEKKYHLLSYAQFSYLTYYIDSSFFKERIVILRDNLRQLFPIQKEEYLEESKEENIELRPESLPIYQAEQLIYNNQFYYSIKSPSEKYSTYNLFDDHEELRNSQSLELETIDVSSDQYALDYFINNCISENDFHKNAIVKLYKKQPLSLSILDNLKKANYLLKQFGGELYLLEESPIIEDYKAHDITLKLFKKHWGEKAEFRNLKVYKNPNLSNEVSEISQGLIVEIIMKEYENSKFNEKTRDLFLTAPTGAGKSLLFQLPAFYVSGRKDVTIVISPLIALMKDQVDAIISDRRFSKVAYLNSELNLVDRDRVIESCKGGEIDILYMSPELFMSYDISHFIGDRKLGLLIIDEAHLITTWGRDFRVDYWFLGNHIQKIRKYHKLNFPMVAVTATAIYGGANDMVFDSIDSLVMHDPHIFIGQVKRDDITFVVNNYDRFTVNYESNKLRQTVDFIKQVNEVGLKTLVYAPYTKHIRQITSELSAHGLDIATGYYGALSAETKEFAFKQFKSGEKKIMISTKAFGMGVDISDIELVYHHAPSGLLPDYVQEIGRVARKPGIKGFAALNYSSQDQRFTKALHGMSALRQYQIREVLKKIHKAYIKNNKNRNLLLSVDDFGHIFENALDLDQKVLTALMMIEKDYLAKNRFNVIIARPKKLFVKVYARISDQHFLAYKSKYHNTYKLLSKLENGKCIIEIDLDSLWYQYFNNKSFPILKREFYTGHLFKNDGIEVIPQLKMSFEILDSFSSISQKLQEFLEKVQSIFSNLSGFFTQKTFEDELNKILKDASKAEKISKFILSSYSGRLIQPGVIEPNAFLQQRRSIDGFEYRVFNNQYLASFTALVNRLKALFGSADNSIANTYVTNKESNTINYVRLGYFLEMLELGTFEIKGGDKPMVFIRINDPLRVERDSKDNNYSNTLLSKTLDRHALSNQIFDHFFLRSFSNDERWNFIEDFFLGSDVDILLEKHKGGDGNNIDIITLLKKNFSPKVDNGLIKSDGMTIMHTFHPDQNTIYKSQNLLTIKDKKDLRTMRISEWLVKDPVALDTIIEKHNLKVDSNVNEILVSKLEVNHFQYYKITRRLNIRITFKGYNRPVQAIVPYKDNPVEFYKWWYEDQNRITMNFQEKLVLFDKVNVKCPNTLKQTHKQLLNQSWL